MTTPRLDAARGSSHDSCDVAVFGGGFGGLYTALAIARDAAPKKLDIALIDDSDSFVFLPLLYDLTVGTASEAEVCPKYKDLLQGTGIRHVQASLESLENQHRASLLQEGDDSTMDFSACVIAVGASPKSILESVPGASDYAQPFYTQPDAQATQELLTRLEQQQQQGSCRIAVVGGGFGGVELAAAVQRRIPEAAVSLLSRGAPMAGTRAEPLVRQALSKLGVAIEDCTVEEITKDEGNAKYTTILKRNNESDDTANRIEDAWDAVLWTAGSGPAYPVSEGLDLLRKSCSGRLEIDSSLRCVWTDGSQPNIWALGDCAEVVKRGGTQHAIPKTAQAAMQQSDVVAANLLAQLDAPVNRIIAGKKFVYLDLGSMLMLGGPNAAVMAPRQGPFDALFAPTLDTVGQVLGTVDQVLAAMTNATPLADKKLSFDALGLSLGSHGLGVVDSVPGTVAGTLAGAARRAVYSARMPTNKQRAVSAFSAALSTATALAKESQK